MRISVNLIRFYDIFIIKLIFMINQTWNVDTEEKLRILNLHESATKNLYLKEQSEVPNEFPKNISFGFPLKPLNKPGSLNAQTDDQGNVFLEWNGELHKLPTIQEIGLPKFWPNNQLFLDGVDEWEWINGFNDYVLARTSQNRNVYIPAYDKSNFSLHFLMYDLVEITKKESKKMRPAEEFLQADSNSYVFGNNKYYVVASDDLPAGGRIPVKGNVTPVIKKTEEKPIVLDITKPFVFDSTELTAEAKPIFDKFVQDVKNNYGGVTADIDVITSSSVDNNPDEKVKGGITRKQYNLNLSNKRALAIVERLKNEIGIPTLNFIPKGVGETTAYGPGWTKERPTTNDETAQNRRLIIKLPQIMKKTP